VLKNLADPGVRRLLNRVKQLVAFDGHIEVWADGLSFANASDGSLPIRLSASNIPLRHSGDTLEAPVRALYNWTRQYSAAIRTAQEAYDADRSRKDGRSAKQHAHRKDHRFGLQETLPEAIATEYRHNRSLREPSWCTERAHVQYLYLAHASRLPVDRPSCPKRGQIAGLL